MVRRLLQPTLTRRLMLAQVALLTLLWSLGAALVIYESVHDDGLMGQDSLFDAVLTVAHNLDGAPAGRSASLAAIDRVLQEDSGAEGDPGM